MPVLDIRRPASTGSPHDRLGEATENVDDGALSSSVATAKTDLVRSIPTPLEETKEEVDQENHAAKNGLLGLEFSRHEASSCAVASPNRDITSTSDPFAVLFFSSPAPALLYSFKQTLSHTIPTALPLLFDSVSLLLIGNSDCLVRVLVFECQLRRLS